MFKGKNNQEPEFEYFTLFDAKVGVYREPMLAINKHDILRQLEQMMRDPKQAQNQLLTNAEDFQLFKIGEFSKRTGVITALHPEHIANLHEIRSMVQRSSNYQQSPPRDVTQRPHGELTNINGSIPQVHPD